jgi:preprotein translocase subunit SecD
MRIVFPPRPLLLAVALALAPTIACKRSTSEAVAVAAKLRIAPVAEDHPWVIAFLTEVSIKRPAGADARLEGRAELDGRYVMDPVITAEDQAALLDFLRSYEQSHPRPPELAPVWERHPTYEAPPVWQLHFIDTQAGFELDGGASATLFRGSEVPAIRLKLSPAQRELFAALTRAQLRRRVAFVIGDEVVNVPIVWEEIPGGEVMLMPEPNRDPEQAAAALLARLQQPG